MTRFKRTVQEINASSMADIAFLLLVFFLVTTTMDTDWGLRRVLPPPVDNPVDIPDVIDRNVLEILVNKDNQLMVEGEVMPLSELRSYAKGFIANAENRSDWPQKKQKTLPFFGDVMVSKQIISLQNDRGTNYATYVHVQNELAAAYRILRNEAARQQFGSSYDELVEKGRTEEVKAVRLLYPQLISEAEIVQTASR